MRSVDLSPRGSWLRGYGGGRWPLAVLDLLLVASIGLGVLVEARFGRVDAVSFYPRKPTWGLGQDWLLISHDDRPGPHTAAYGPAGRRLVDILVFHLPHEGGRPTLAALPPEADVPIAGYGHGPLALAFARGGASLLVSTFEAATQLNIERYAEVDLAGLAATADAVGGVRMCGEPGRAARCRRLSGGGTLRYLRGDGADRRECVEHRRALIAALIGAAGSPSVLLNPFRGLPFALAGARAVTIDRDGHLYDVIRLALGLRRNRDLVMIPTLRRPPAPGGAPIVEWDHMAMGRLITAMVTDRPVPADLTHN